MRSGSTAGKETRLAEIAGEYESYLDELSEEDKEQDFVNDGAFVAAEVKKAIKAREVEPAILSILKDVNALFAEEKTLKSRSRTTVPPSTSAPKA